MNALPRYDVFVSYAHDDRELAEALQSGLRSFGRGLLQLWALRVFLDSSNVGAPADLWANRLAPALASSDYLVLIATPAASRSDWVKRELDFWLQQGKRRPRLHSAEAPELEPAERLFVIHTSGQIRRQAGQIDWSTTDCLPGLLDHRWLAEEQEARAQPRDCRSVFEDRLILEGRDFAPSLRRNVRKISAEIHQVPEDVHETREVRGQRFRVRALAYAISVLVVLLLGMVHLWAMSLTREELASSAGRLAIAEAKHAQRSATEAYNARYWSQMNEAGALSHSQQIARAQAVLESARQSDQDAATILRSVLEGTYTPPVWRTTVGHERAVMDIAVLSGRDRFLTCSQDGSIVVWGALTGETVERAQVAGGHGIRLAVLPGQRSFLLSVTGTSPRVELWSVAPLSRVRILARFPRGATVLALTESGDGFVAMGFGGFAEKWRLSANREATRVRVSDRFKKAGNHFYAGARLPDGGVVAALSTWGRPETALVCFSSDLDRQRVVEIGPISPFAVAVLPGAFVVGGKNNLESDRYGVRILSERGEEQAVFNGHAGNLSMLAITPDAKLIVSAAEDGRLLVWDRSARLVHQYEGSQQGFSALCLAGEERYLVTGGEQGEVAVWPLTDGGSVWRWPRGGLVSVDVAPSGRFALVGDTAGHLVCLDLATLKPFWVANTAHQAIWSVAISPDGEHVAHVGSGAQVALRRVDSGELLGRLDVPGGPEAIRDVCFSPQGDRLACVDANGSLHVLGIQRDVKRGHPSLIRQGTLKVVEGTYLFTVAFIEEGRRLLCGGDIGTGYLVSATVPLGPLDEIKLPGDGYGWACSSLAEGGALISAYSELVWLDQLGRRAGLLRGHKTKILGVAQLSDRFACSVGEGGQLMIWDLSRRGSALPTLRTPFRLIGRGLACGRLGRAAQPVLLVAGYPGLRRNEGRLWVVPVDSRGTPPLHGARLQPNAGRLLRARSRYFAGGGERVQHTALQKIQARWLRGNHELMRQAVEQLDSNSVYHRLLQHVTGR